jgi:hypothetical protein
MIELLLIGIPLIALICVLWVRGIDRMNKKYPKYRGEDYLDEDF